jgi:hypothetical protein
MQGLLLVREAVHFGQIAAVIVTYLQPGLKKNRLITDSSSSIEYNDIKSLLLS